MIQQVAERSENRKAQSVDGLTLERALDEVRALAAADQSVRAAESEIQTISARWQQCRDRCEALRVDLASPEPSRAPLRIQADLQDEEIARQELERAAATARSRRADVARRLWSEQLEPLLKRLLTPAVEELHERLSAAKAADARVRLIGTVAHEVMPSGADISALQMLGFQPLTGRFEDWQRFVGQELQIKL